MTYYPPNQPQRPAPPTGGFQRPPIPARQYGPPPGHRPQGPQYGPPQQPQYGPPQQKPTFSKNTLIALVIAAVVVAGVAAVLLINVFNKPNTISANTVKSDLESQLAEQGNNSTVENFTCPEMEAQKGATYTCTADIDGAKIKVEVTVQDDDGTIFWEVKGL